MASRFSRADILASERRRDAATARRAVTTIAAPPPAPAPAPPSGGIRQAPVVRSGGGGGGGGLSAQQIAANNAAAAENRAKQAAKDQSVRENEASQRVIDALLDSLGGYEKGRDTQIANADRVLKAALAGIGRTYTQAVNQYNEAGEANEQDEASKSAANVQNRARERLSLLTQAATQGAGETDQLRVQLQAFQNFDANALEVARGFYDTQQSINSQIAGAASQAETSRRAAWMQSEEARGTAWNEYWKNRSDVWTNIQRTRAGNNNVDGDYSVAFNPNLRGMDEVAEASRDAGRAYQVKDKSEAWYRNFDGRQGPRNTRLNSTNRAATATIQGPRAAEGATLRGRW
jgi:hypothetical protein